MLLVGSEAILSGIDFGSGELKVVVFPFLALKFGFDSHSIIMKLK